MKTIVKYSIAAAAILAISVITSPVMASASVSALPGGPFTLGNPIGKIPTSSLSGPDAHDFTFSWADAETNVLLGTDNAGSKEISFQLFAGAPGAGSFL